MRSLLNLQTTYSFTQHQDTRSKHPEVYGFRSDSIAYVVFLLSFIIQRIRNTFTDASNRTVCDFGILAPELVEMILDYIPYKTVLKRISKCLYQHVVAFHVCRVAEFDEWMNDRLSLFDRTFGLKLQRHKAISLNGARITSRYYYYVTLPQTSNARTRVVTKMRTLFDPIKCYLVHYDYEQLKDFRNVTIK